MQHGFGPTDRHKVSIAEVLRGRGITYINAPFDNMQNRAAVSHGLFGFDAGVLTVDRGEDLMDWRDFDKALAGKLRGCTCGMHWPHLLHPNPERNSEVVDTWVRFRRPCHEAMDTMLGTNSESF